jgi:hypothetical protein
MAGELGSDDGLDYASWQTSEEAVIPRAQLRKIRNRRRTMHPARTHTHALSSRTSLALASRKVRSSAS